MLAGQDLTALLFATVRWLRAFCFLHQYACETLCILAGFGVLQVKHQPPRQVWRAVVFRLVMSQPFDVAAMAAIVANCIVMAMTHADMNIAWQDFMTWANLGFTAFFTLEMLLKFVALGFKPVLRVSKAWALPVHNQIDHQSSGLTNCLMCAQLERNRRV